MVSISIIIPVYNLQDCLSRCIDSVLLQSYADFELILVDDGSTDNSLSICNKYAENDERITVIHQENNGVSAARNTGIKAARGDYISFIDGDDWVTETYLQRMITVAKEYNADLVTCNFKNIDSYLNVIPLPQIATVLTREEAFKNLSLDDTIFRSPWAKIIKRNIVENHLFPEKRSYLEDTACVYLWIADSKIICKLNEIHYYYFKRIGSAVNREYGKERIGAFATYREMLSFFQKEKLPQQYHKVLVISLIELISGIEICRSLYKEELLNELNILLINTLKEFLNIEITAINNREELIPYLSFDRTIKQMYIERCANSLADSFKKERHLKTENEYYRLKNVLVRYHPSIRKCPGAYEIVYPKIMTVYWIINSKMNSVKKMHLNNNNQ